MEAHFQVTEDEIVTIRSLKGNEFYRRQFAEHQVPIYQLAHNHLFQTSKGKEMNKFENKTQHPKKVCLLRFCILSKKGDLLCYIIGFQSRFFKFYFLNFYDTFNFTFLNFHVLCKFC